MEGCYLVRPTRTDTAVFLTKYPLAYHTRDAPQVGIGRGSRWARLEFGWGMGSLRRGRAERTFGGNRVGRSTRPTPDPVSNRRPELMIDGNRRPMVGSSHGMVPQGPQREAMLWHHIKSGGPCQGIRPVSSCQPSSTAVRLRHRHGCGGLSKAFAAISWVPGA